MLNEILENAMIQSLVGVFNRSPYQVNALQETDAELVRITPGAGGLLAVTTDSLAEEMSSGLYTDPYMIGWMTVMVNMSDLAAVGARPVGLLISELISADFTDEARQRLQLGIKEAAALCGTFVLGGDTNLGNAMVMTGCAIGTLERGRYLSRKGCRPGDILYATGRVGRGNAFALSRFLSSDGNSFAYLPIARLAEGRSLLSVASSCMDTSDGVIAALDQLMRLNGVGFQLDEGWEDLLDLSSKELANTARIPLWLLVAGHHGEFELLFTVPECLDEECAEAAQRTGWSPVRLGSVTEEITIRLPLYGRNRPLETAEIRNLAALADLDVRSYISSLLRIDGRMRSL
jgi:thiamine-monophosphate kinase